MEDYLTTYLNIPEVKKALHIEIPSKVWEACDDPIFRGWPLMDSFSDVTNLYSLLYSSPKKVDNFKMLIFSGDSDSVCGTVGTQHWVYNITDTFVNTLWQKWSVRGQTAGYVTVFERIEKAKTRTKKEIKKEIRGRGEKGIGSDLPTDRPTTHLAFATVHNSGHEAPRYQPVNTFGMYSSFLNGRLVSKN
jgi:hypothetical protein